MILQRAFVAYVEMGVAYDNDGSLMTAGMVGNRGTETKVVVVVKEMFLEGSTVSGGAGRVE